MVVADVVVADVVGDVRSLVEIDVGTLGNVAGDDAAK